MSSGTRFKKLVLQLAFACSLHQNTLTVELLCVFIIKIDLYCYYHLCNKWSHNCSDILL